MLSFLHCHRPLGYAGAKLLVQETLYTHKHTHRLSSIWVVSERCHFPLRELIFRLFSAQFLLTDSISLCFSVCFSVFFSHLLHIVYFVILGFTKGPSTMIFPTYTMIIPYFWTCTIVNTTDTTGYKCDFQYHLLKSSYHCKVTALFFHKDPS